MQLWRARADQQGTVLAGNGGEVDELRHDSRSLGGGRRRFEAQQVVACLGIPYLCWTSQVTAQTVSQLARPRMTSIAPIIGMSKCAGASALGAVAGGP